MRSYPTVTARVDSGYRGLAKAFPDRICAPPPAPGKDAPVETIAVYKQARTRQSSRRICVEHAIAEHKQWRPMQPYLGRREAYAEHRRTTPRRLRLDSGDSTATSHASCTPCSSPTSTTLNDAR
jgi:hypothetical protein